jgi:hypothetical protein
MRTPWSKAEFEMVEVEVHGRLLDCMSFESREEAEGYKRGVRQWAREKGILVAIRTHRAYQQILPQVAGAGAGLVTS